MTMPSADDRSYVLAVTRRILRCEDLAADATQDAMLLARPPGLARGLLAAIDGKHRDVFVLRAADHTETEIAARLGISVANVKIRAHRIRKQLRHSLHTLYAIDGDLALSA